MNPILEVGAMSGRAKLFEGHRAGGLKRVGSGSAFLASPGGHLQKVGTCGGR